MKSPLTYLLFTKLKNQFKSFFKSPGKIIYLVIFVLVIGASLIGGKGADRMPDRKIRDIGELTAIVTAYYTFMFVILSYKGFSSGASMFSMADVNMVFTAPFRQQKVLFYGLFQQLGTSLLFGFFLVFQYTWLHNAYNITYGDLMIILLGYVLTIFFGQITAMVIYAFTSADDRRKNIVKGIYLAIFGAELLYVAVRCLSEPSQLLQRAVGAAGSLAVKLLPVSGWFGCAVSGVLRDNAADILLGAAVAAAYFILFICFITYGKQEYYEDVIKSSEIAQSAITARKEGRVGDIAPKNVKVGKTGIGKGIGADTIYYKHKLENRRSRVLILEPMSLIFAVMTIAMALFMKKLGILPVFVTAAFYQIMTVALGRINKELAKPYIYLIPEPPLMKMLYALAELGPSAVVEALVIFVPVAFILGLTPLETALCVAARLSYTFLFTGVNIAVTRLWGGNPSKMLVAFLYFALVAAMALPGIVLAVILAVMNPGMLNVMVLLSLTVCNVPVALLVLYLCRNMLQYAELNNR